MAEDHSDELRSLREEVRQLQVKLTLLSQRLDVLSKPKLSSTPPPLPTVAPSVPPVVSTPPPLAKPLPTTPPPIPQQTPPIISPPLAPVAPAESFEVRFGTYWLPRIGMTVLLTGIVFLITWSYQYLGAAGKVGLSYLSCAVLGALGFWLEKKTPPFARVLQAGALALTYFVTFAAHFVESFRVIHSLPLAIALLLAVVVAIVFIADRRKSETLAGMALFFGYWTSLASGIDEFTLISNAVLAVAALFFLWRNAWTGISFGALIATYVAFFIWAAKGHFFVFFDDSPAHRLTVEEFYQRAAFLWIYWTLFASGALIVRRDKLEASLRNGLLLLNNIFFFALFSLFLRGMFEHRDWLFLFIFGGAILATATAAWLRFKEERSIAELLLLQGLGVVTLGVMDYFKGSERVAALALECVFILLFARAARIRWIAWVGRAAFAIASVQVIDATFDAAPGETAAWSAWFTVAAGFVCARLAKQKPTGGLSFDWSAVSFALASTCVGMRVGFWQCDASAQPWMLMGGAALVVLIGVALRVSEITWMSNLPLLWANVQLLEKKIGNEEWALLPSLALIAVNFGFGIGTWARIRSRESEGAKQNASTALLVYSLAGTFAIVQTTFSYAPDSWCLTVFVVESLVFLVAASLAAETVFLGIGAFLAILGAISYVVGKSDEPTVVWANLIVSALLLVAGERLIKMKGESMGASGALKRNVCIAFVAAIGAVSLYGLWKLADSEYLTVSWAGLGFVLLALGFIVRDRPYRLAGLATLGFSLLRAIVFDLSRLAVPYRILSFIGLGAVLLVLGYFYAKNREKLSKWL